MTISSPGIGSNLDVNGIVQKLMSAEQGPLNIVTQQKTNYQSKISAYGSLKSSLSTFQATVDSLSSASRFMVQSATAGDSSVFTATSNGKASLGNYSIEVQQLAQAHKISPNAGFASTSDSVGTGTLSIAFGTYDSSGNTFTLNADKASKSITITSANNTLAGIRDAINLADAGVTASIVNDGGTAGNRIVITSKDSGTVNSIKISVTDNDATNLDNSGLSQLAYDPTLTIGAGKNASERQAAKDARLSIDGINVTKSTNVVSDAIEGVTINLLKTNAGSANTLAVTHDTDKIKTSVNAFVKAFNDLNSTIRSLTKYDEAGKTGGPLLGDGTTRSITTQIRNVLTGAIGSSGTLTTLSQIGVSFQRDGTLAVDSTKLDASITNNFNDIATLFSASASFADAQLSFIGNTKNTQAGNYAVMVSALATQGTLLGSSAPNLNIVSGVNDTLNLQIDGTSVSITLDAASYASAQELAAAIQSKIAGTGSAAKVAVNGGALQITSANYGSTSSIALSGGNGSSDALGAPTASSGVNVAGSINGVAATGQGQNLIGATANASEGLVIRVAGGNTGARGSANFTMGYAYLLNQMSKSVLADDGLLSTRTNGITSSITRLTAQESTLQDRLAIIERGYRAQFTALDTMISSLQQTSSFLTQQLAQLQSNRN
ncbi:MAG: flagellar filament capping protein FliD [Methylophilaceae bacterium]